MLKYIVYGKNYLLTPNEIKKIIYLTEDYSNGKRKSCD